MDKDSRLGMLASAILDGTPVDWNAADSTAEASERGVIRNLQIVAEIAALHRQPDADSALVGITDEAPRAVPSTASWGHLRLLEPVGRGAFGQVYRAWDTHLDREVALEVAPHRPRC